MFTGYSRQVFSLYNIKNKFRTCLTTIKIFYLSNWGRRTSYLARNTRNNAKEARVFLTFTKIEGAKPSYYPKNQKNCNTKLLQTVLLLHLFVRAPHLNTMQLKSPLESTYFVLTLMFSGCSA